MAVLNKMSEIVCPNCLSDLKEISKVNLMCSACSCIYSVEKQIINLLDKSAHLLNKEIEVQEQAAVEYEAKRNKLPWAKRYRSYWTSRMINHLDDNSCERILENGCGTGSLYEFIPSDRIIGLDISPKMLCYASKHMENIILGNSLKLPFRDDSFSLVFCKSLLHHLPNKKQAISEIHRVLRPGGKVVFSDTNSSIFSIIPRFIANRTNSFAETHQNLSKDIITSLLTPEFSIDEHEYFGYIAYPILGFPDLLNLFSVFPFKAFIEKVLIKLDDTLSRIPIINTQAWGIIIKATKK